MSRKDYESFAALFAGEIALAELKGERQTVVNVVRSSADIFAQGNPRFDRERFYTASGLTVISSHCPSCGQQAGAEGFSDSHNACHGADKTVKLYG